MQNNNLHIYGYKLTSSIKAVARLVLEQKNSTIEIVLSKKQELEWRVSIILFDETF